MTKAFVDTTILTDALLKAGEDARAAGDAVGRFEESQLPVYAIKEFKYGPLQHYVWLRNKLAQLQSYSAVFRALRYLVDTPWHGRKVSTALEALETLAAVEPMPLVPPDSSIAERYGTWADPDRARADHYRLWLDVHIRRAWRQRRSLTTHTVQELSCYNERDPFEENGRLQLRPRMCTPDPECCLASQLRARPADLRRLRAATDGTLPNTLEHRRRSSVLRKMSRKAHAPMTDQECRALGDAYFALFAPQDAVILTTNLRDHQPLAECLGKTARSPRDA